MMQDNGLRLLLVGYESGNQQILNNIKKGMRIEHGAASSPRIATSSASQFTAPLSSGFPVKLPRRMEETIRFAIDINPHTIQVSLAAPYPGTELYRQAVENNWLDGEHAELVDEHGLQIAPLHFPHLSHRQIFQALETMYKRFYFRPAKIASLVKEMVCSPEMMKRRLREGVEFFQFLYRREMPA